MRDQVPVVALSVLDQTEDGPDQDEGTTTIKSIKMFLPRIVAAHAAAGRNAIHANVEGDADNDEKAKEEDLDDKTTDGYVFAGFERLKCARSHDTTTCCL